MKARFRLLRRVVLGLFALGLSLATRLPARGLEVLVVTDFVSSDGDYVPPTAEHPAHYIFLGGEELALGQPSARTQSPSWDEVQARLREELERQHFKLTEPGGPVPDLVLVCNWGEANLMTDDFEESNAETGEIETSSVSYNMRDIRRLAGAGRSGLNRLSMAEFDRLNTVLNEDRLYLMVAALDAAALRRKEKKLVWRTWISIPLIRHALTTDLAAMIAGAGPHFGRITDLPTFIDDRDRNAEVEIGEAIVVDEPAAP